jgi:hypothetical protein
MSGQTGQDQSGQNQSGPQDTAGGPDTTTNLAQGRRVGSLWAWSVYSTTTAAGSGAAQAPRV